MVWYGMVWCECGYGLSWDGVGFGVKRLCGGAWVGWDGIAPADFISRKPYEKSLLRITKSLSPSILGLEKKSPPPHVCRSKSSFSRSPERSKWRARLRASDLGSGAALYVTTVSFFTTSTLRSLSASARCARLFE